MFLIGADQGRVDQGRRGKRVSLVFDVLYLGKVREWRDQLEGLVPAVFLQRGSTVTNLL